MAAHRPRVASGKQAEAVPKLPEANEFSPGQVDLRVVLGIADADPGDRKAQVEEIRQTYFAAAAGRHTDPGKRMRQQLTRANNVLIGMKGYGLYSLDENALTETGRRLLREADDEALHVALAKHILLNCHGIEVLRAVRSMQQRRERVTKNTLDVELRVRGFTTLPRATTHHLTLLNWLAKANVIEGSGKYQINEARAAELAGIGLETVDEWQVLTRSQRAFLRTLRRLAESGGSAPIPGHDLIDAVAYEHGRVFVPDGLRDNVFRPLEEAGWFIASGIGPGRGGKSGLITPTDKLLATDFELLTGYAAGNIPADLMAKLDTPLQEIASDLAASESHRKGVALELLALRLARDLGLVPVSFRLRGAKTGGGEVDLLVEGAHLHFSRWLFQCKNQKSRVPLSDLAKEVGMATLLHGHVIVMVTTGAFASSVTDYAEELARTSALQVVLMDGAALRRYLKSGASWLLDYFHGHAQSAMREKRPQVLESLEEAEEQ